MRRKILWSILIVFLLLMIAVGWLLSTQSGLRTVISVAENVVPELEIEQAQGTLLNQLHLQNLTYKPGNGNGVEVADITLEWQPSALLKATLLIEKLAVSDVTVFLSEAEELQTEPGPISLPEVVLPLRVEVAELTVSNVQSVTADNENVALINQFNTSVNVDYDTLQIHQFSIERDDVSVDLTGNVALQSPYQTALNYQVNVKQALASPFQLDGKVEGDIEKLEITQTIGAPLASTQSATITHILEDLEWSLLLQADAIDLADIVPEQHITLNSIDVTANGDLTSLNANVSSQVLQADMPPLAVMAAISSEDFETWAVNSQAAISEQSQLTLTGDISLKGETPTAQLQAMWQNLQWPLVGDEAVAKSANGSVIFSGSAAAYTTSIETALEVQQQALTLTAEANGTQNDIKIEQLVVNGFDGQLHADGHLDWQAAPMQYQFNADWQGLKLPPSLSELAVELKQGKIRLDGTPQALSLSTEADVLLDNVSMTINADASGQTDTGFEQTQLNIALAEGKSQYSGKILWANALLLDGVLSLEKLNPGILAPQWPGELSGQTQLRVASQADTGIQAQAQNIDIHGSLRNRPLKLNGAVDYSQDLLDVKQLQLQSGQSSLQADGQIRQEDIAFDWVLKSPDLQDFHPDMTGQLNASGNVKGSLQAPEIQADLSGSAIGYQDIQAQSLTGNINLAMSQNANLDTQLEITGLDLPQLAIDSLKIGLDGRQQNHELTVDMVSEAMALTIAARGGLNEQTWQGKLNRFSLENAKAGKWTLQQNAELMINADEQHIPKHCWAATKGEFCLQADNSVKGWQTSGQFAAVPMSLFEAFMVQLEQIQGTLRGDFTLVANKGEAITGEGDIFLDDASLKLEQSAFNQQKPITLNNTALSYKIDAAQTLAKFHLEPDVEGVSAVDANFETTGLSQLLESAEAAPLKGTITTAIQDLSQLQLSHPAVTDLKGKFDLNLAISGTTTQPEIEGKASLAEGQVVIVDAGIMLKQLEVNIDGNLDQVTFDYQATSGKGTLKGEGAFTLTQSSWELKTALKAEQFRVMNTPEALVIAEPDLTVLVTPELTQVSGKVTIPEAELEPTQFNSTVSPSQDVTVIRDEPTEAQKGPTTEVDVRIILGDKVKLKALGFQGRLTGDLRVTGNTNDILLGNGEIKIIDGSYLAYGRLLHVDDGSIRFAGGAIDNPELDIKAVRIGDDYQAGLHIEGYASAPQATLFSKPNMSQDNILSHILLGKPIEQASATDAALLASAASGLGLQNGAMMGDQIASTFGLDEFSVQGDSAENAALQVGKYLSPKLYLSYGIGVFESVSTVELRYQLSKIWSLKAESGTESGVDLLYTYERGGPE